MGYSFRLAAMVLLYAPSHRQDSTYSRGALAGTRNSSMGPPHERTPLPRSCISFRTYKQSGTSGKVNGTVPKPPRPITTWYTLQQCGTTHWVFDLRLAVVINQFAHFHIWRHQGFYSGEHHLYVLGR